MTNTSRQQALLNGDKHFFTGEPCKHGHISERTITDGACVECRRMWSYASNKNITGTNKTKSNPGRQINKINKSNVKISRRKRIELTDDYVGPCNDRRGTFE